MFRPYVRARPLDFFGLQFLVLTIRLDMPSQRRADRDSRSFLDMIASEIQLSSDPNRIPDTELTFERAQK